MASGEELLAKTQCRYNQAYHSHSAPDRPVPPIEALTIHRCGSPSWRLAKREADAKWLGARSPTSQAKRHVNRCIQPVTDEPFLNRVSRSNPVREQHHDRWIKNALTLGESEGGQPLLRRAAVGRGKSRRQWRRPTILCSGAIPVGLPLRPLSFTLAPSRDSVGCDPPAIAGPQWHAATP